MDQYVDIIFASSDIPYIITKALSNYDLHNTAITVIKKKTNVKIFSSNINLKRDTLTFELIDGLKKYKTEIEILGTYYKTQGIWCWAWGNTLLKRQQIFNSKELLLYGLNLEFPAFYIKNLLITSRGMIDDPIQVDIIIALALFLRKRKYIYPLIEKEGPNTVITYYVLFNENIIDDIYEEIKKN